MHLFVERFASNNETTLSGVYVDGVWQCFGLEDEYRAPGKKVKGETRIPAGSYELALHPKSRFQSTYRARYGDQHAGMVHVKNVPGFKWILIHSGNRDEHTDGCLLVGETVSQNVRTGDGEIAGSRAAYERVILPLVKALAAGKRCTIRFFDGDLRAREWPEAEAA